MSINDKRRARRAAELADAAAETTVKNLTHKLEQQTAEVHFEEIAKEIENIMTNNESAIVAEAEEVTVIPAALSVEELLAMQDVETGTRNSIISGQSEAVVERDPNRAKEYDIVLVTGQRDYNKINVVFAALDRINPDFVVLGETGRADGMALAWAKSRGVQFKIVTADWDTHQNSAGPIRNGEALDLVRKIMLQRQKTACHLFFVNPRLGRDRAVDSMYNTAASRNDTFASRAVTRPYVIPIIGDGRGFAEGWLEDDLNASAAKHSIPGMPDADFPDTLMQGARRLPDMDQARPAVIVSTEPPY